MEIIKPSDNVLDLGISMSSNGSFDFHIQNLCNKCSNLSGWILRTFTTRDSNTMKRLECFSMVAYWAIGNIIDNIMVVR